MSHPPILEVVDFKLFSIPPSAPSFLKIFRSPATGGPDVNGKEISSALPSAGVYPNPVGRVGLLLLLSLALARSREPFTPLF